MQYDEIAYNSLAAQARASRSWRDRGHAQNIVKPGLFDLLERAGTSLAVAFMPPGDGTIAEATP
jgi:hypothetical protein